MNKEYKLNINLNNEFDLINNNLEINIINTNIGKIIIIDNFLKNPDIFKKFYYKNKLVNNHQFPKNISVAYPGPIFSLSWTLNKEFNNFKDKYIKKHLNLDYLNNIVAFNYSYRLLNKKNNELSIENMLPHNHTNYFKEGDRKWCLKGLSSCLYLYDKNQISNGTSFYKEKIKIKGNIIKKQIEYVNNKPIFDNDSFYNKNTEETEYLKNILLNPKYNADKKNIFYEKIYSIDAKFNRCLFFSNEIYHNFDIDNTYYNNIQDMDYNRLTIVGLSFYNNKFKINDVDLNYLLESKLLI